ncbi:MAG: hypothetical protein LBC73_04885 [Oscillospiraceae bacterium]|jgi:hypothetical protein|nr:hypothetical protein [Oscillospiraceae bacterium]
MQEIILDEEFQRILPKLSEQTLAGLEINLLEFGCLMPLVLWNGILIDGYNRYELLKKHDLPFNTVEMDFPSREEVKIWIIKHQIEQRNLNPIQLSYYRGLHYNLDKRPQSEIQRLQGVAPEAQNGPQGGSTANRLAELYKVSRNTIKRDSKLAIAIDKIGEISPEAKMDILSGEISITRRQLKELETGTDEDIDVVVLEMLEGTFEKTKGDPKNATITKIPTVSFSTDLQSFNSINDITKTFYAKLKTLSSNEDKVGSKSALRLYIDTLEELYKQI